MSSLSGTMDIHVLCDRNETPINSAHK